MARFASAPQAAPASAPYSIGRTPTPTATYEGGQGWAPDDPHVELFNAALSGLLTDGFYETGDQRVERIAALVHQCNPIWLGKFTRWLRETAGLRSAPIVIAAEYVHAGYPNARTMIQFALKRPDEPGELLGYWRSRYGRQIPQRLKRGIADTLPDLYHERSMLRWDGQGKAWRFADVIEVVHPKPADAQQSALYKFALDRRRGALPPDELPILKRTAELDAIAIEQRSAHVFAAAGIGWPWERIAGWLPNGMDARAWEAVIPRLGYLALVRNLNNFDRAGVNDEARAHAIARLTDRGFVERSGILPYQLLTAYSTLEADTYKLALGTAADMALANLPHLPGRTLIMVDCSGSMRDPAGGGKSRNPLSLSYVAGLMAEAIGRRCDESMICTYSTEPIAAMPPMRHVGVLRAAADGRYEPRGGTQTWRCVREVVHSSDAPIDRVIVLTDEQTSDRDDGSVTCPVITWNLAGYRAHHAAHGSAKRYLLSGYNDFAMQVLPFLAGGTGKWPWEQS